MYWNHQKEIMAMDINIIDWIKENQKDVMRVIENRPVITLAYAQSLDGSFTRKQGITSAISSGESSVLTHKLRASHSAIMIGSGTLLADNPRLTVRLAEGSDPVPVLIDTHLQIPLSARILQTSSRLIVFCSHAADIKKREDLAAMGIQIIALQIDKSGFLPLPEVVEILFKTGVTSLMVEGGPKLIHSFLSLDLWDLAVITMAPFWMGGYGLDHYEFKEKIWLQNLQIFQKGPDIILSGSRI